MKKNISIFDFKSGTDYLGALYKSIVETNPRYSLRSFAQKIGLDQSSLVRYLAGERSLSPNKSHVIAENLKLSEMESHYFKLLTSFGDKGEYEILERLRTGFLFERQRVLNRFSEADDYKKVGVQSHRESLNAAEKALTDYEKCDMEIYTSVIAVKKEGREKIHEAIKHLQGLISEYASEQADDSYLVTTYMLNLASENSSTKA